MANNPYVNRVLLADGTALIDISDTTATANDVVSGKYFYGSNGAYVSGSYVPEIYDNGDEIAYGSVGAIGTWYFNATLDFAGYDQSGSLFDKNINFQSNNVSYSRINGSAVSMPPMYIAFFRYDQNEVYSTTTGNGWSNSTYRTINITGGDDVNDSELLAFLELNAVKVEV